MRRTNPIRFGELFSGPGGLSLGLRQAAANLEVPVEHRWAVEIERDAAATYQLNFPDAKVYNEDVRDVDFSELEPVDGLGFGFPCNDFSLVGRQKGVTGKYGPLYKECTRALEVLRPKWFLAENVGGIRSANAGHAFDTILREFRDIGYTITPHLFRFEEYGVPQNRHRILIVGIRSDLGLRYSVPQPSGKLVSARTAIETPPITLDAPNHTRTRQSERVIERLQSILPGQNAFNSTLPKRLKLNVRGAFISQIYRRLDPDLPAYTVTGSGGGGTHVYHWSEPRALTNRERARLQSFPDSYRFVGTSESVRRQVGMAVPPRGAKLAFQALLKTLAGKSYRSVEPNLGHRHAGLLRELTSEK